MPERFEVFHLREYPKVVGLLHGLLGSRLVAEELAQETFLVAYRDWDRISRLDNPRAWVRKVAINQRGSFLRAYLRQQTRERHAVMQYQDDKVEEQLEGRRPMILAGGANPAQDPAASLCLALLNHSQHLSSLPSCSAERLCLRPPTLNHMLGRCRKPRQSAKCLRGSTRGARNHSRPAEGPV